MTYVNNYKEMGKLRLRNRNPIAGRREMSRGFGQCRALRARSRTRLVDNCRQGLRSGNGRGVCINPEYSEGDKDLLISQKEFLEERIEFINEQIEKL